MLRLNNPELQLRLTYTCKFLIPKEVWDKFSKHIRESISSQGEVYHTLEDQHKARGWL